MPDYIDEALGPEGRLSKLLEGYESRQGQLDLARAVDATFSAGGHLMAEAPCGIGKSLAYLVPAVHHALASERKVVIATANIVLQEQLISKDLPVLAQAMPEPFKFALIKGRGNYLCPARLLESQAKPDLFMRADDRIQLEKIKAWAKGTQAGDKSELDFEPKYQVWGPVCGDTEDCDGERCGAVNCFSNKAHALANKAHVIVCNYHVLFSDLVTGGALLPEYKLLVCDEGHEMAEIARRFFGFEVTDRAVKRIADMLRAQKLADEARALEDASGTFFQSAKAYAESPTYKARIRHRGFADGFPLLDCIRIAARELRAAGADESEDERKKFERRVRQAETLAARIEDLLTLGNKNFVYCAELQKKKGGWPKLVGMPVLLGGYLSKPIFENLDAVVMTSATLTADRAFDYIREEVGAPATAEFIAESPFDFKSQCLLILPEMLNDPNGRGFGEEVAEKFAEVIEAADGRTMGLFTSYKVMHQVYERIRESRFKVLVQGDQPRLKLIEEFKANIGSVLLGTASFWTGVDIPGEALSCLVIDKLPFNQVDDPVMDLRSSTDDQWFKKWSLPKAVLDLRQGFGRLIRRKTDRGVVVVFDSRLVKKGYGKTFLRSLPRCPIARKMETIKKFLGGDRLELLRPS